RHGVHVDDGVDALGSLVDLVGKAPAAPHVDLVHAPAPRGDHAQELLQGRLDGVFLETRVEDDHHFVVAHKRNCPLWTDGHGLSVTGGTASTRAGRGAGRDADAQAYQARGGSRAGPAPDRGARNPGATAPSAAPRCAGSPALAHCAPAAWRPGPAYCGAG